MMQLIEWIEENGKTRQWCAKKIGVNMVRIYRILSGFEPTLAEVMEIEKMTRHKVRMEDFLTAKKEQGRKLKAEAKLTEQNERKSKREKHRT